MRRREFISLFGGTAAAWPLTARAQQPSKLPTVGFLSPNSYAAAKTWTTAFVKRLQDLGWTEGKTVQIEYRWEDGQVERTSEFITELVGLKVDVIVTHGVPNIVAAIKTTPAVPVVFPLATDRPSQPAGVTRAISHALAPVACRRVRETELTIP